MCRGQRCDSYPHGVRDLFSSQAEVVVLGFQLPALSVQHLPLDILLWGKKERKGGVSERESTSE